MKIRRFKPEAATLVSKVIWTALDINNSNYYRQDVLLNLRNILFASIILGLFSCSSNNTKDNIKNKTVAFNSAAIDTFLYGVGTSSIYKKFEVDDYPVTYEMFKNENTDYITYGKTESIDKAWFKNEKLNQILIFELYTDGHRLETYHFYNHEIPSDIIERIELHTFDGNFASTEQKLIDLKGFVKASENIDSKYFTSLKGLKLGDSMSKSLAIYGLPDKKSVNNGVEILEWNFIGDFFYDGKEDLKGKPLAKNNYGHQVYLYYKNGKLIGQILHNDIP